MEIDVKDANNIPNQTPADTTEVKKMHEKLITTYSELRPGRIILKKLGFFSSIPLVGILTIFSSVKVNDNLSRRKGKIDQK